MSTMQDKNEPQAVQPPELVPTEAPEKNERDRIEEQDSLLKFPCDFPIKVMGLTREDFARTIASAVHEIVPDFNEENLTQSRSKTGKYTSLTLNIRATSRAQLDSIYLMLTSHPMVKVVL